MAFDHLSLPYRLTGLYNSPYGPGKRVVVVLPSETTISNQENRKDHGDTLNKKTGLVTREWTDTLSVRKEKGLPNVPESIPLFLQVDPKTFKPDSLKSFGIEIISEEDDGFLIGASADLNLSTLKDKIDKFLKKEGKFKNTASQLWDIVTGKQWRIDHILSNNLLNRWDEIDDSQILIVDIAIACFVHIPAYPNKGKEDEVTQDQYEEKINRWEEKKRKAEIDWDEISFKRQDEIEKFVVGHQGILLSDYVNSTDSFSCRIEISGIGLKDMVFNYPYLFEVEEYDNLKQSINIDKELEKHPELEIKGPEYEDPNVCVIDSGIQEDHILLTKSIDKRHSISYVKGQEKDVSDKVVGGGHGTRVAGAVLYSKLPISTSTIKLNVWVQNARVLDDQNTMQSNLYPPNLIKDIVEYYNESYYTRIFNMSITSRKGHITTRMSKWAESIDREIWERDIIFVIPTGNLRKDAIADYVNGGKLYADYLLVNKSRVSNPSQSLFSLTVGSICHGEYNDSDLESLGEKDFPSSFTRTGLGIWDSLKPELVEYGGDYVIEKRGAKKLISQKKDTSIHLVRSTLNGGPSTSVDGIGTSFTAPKVSGVIAELQRLFPEETTLLYKVLIIQSARWPGKIFNEAPKLNFLRLYGYGVPNIERASTNNEYRTTLVQSLAISPKEADVFQVKLPESIRRAGDSFDILIEVTLTFKAKPRRTRVGFRSYLSGWVDWHSSLFGESVESFEKRLISGDYIDEDDDTINQESIPWVIQSRSNAGINNIKLNHSVTQKDWAIVKSNKLTESFCIGVVGHTGWNKDLKSQLPYSIAVSFEALNKDIEIYNSIRIENPIEVKLKV